MSSLVYLPDISAHGLVQTVRAAVWACYSSSSLYYLLLRLPLRAAIKMASFIVQLAQDHVVLEEKLVSHAESAERNKNMELGPWFVHELSKSRGPGGTFQSFKTFFFFHSIYEHHLCIIRKLIFHDCRLINYPSDIQSFTPSRFQTVQRVSSRSDYNAHDDQ